MNAIAAGLDHTPWWVYLLLVILVRRGIKAGQPNVMAVWKLAILPLIFAAMDVLAMVKAPRIGAGMVMSWIVFLAIGGRMGALLMRTAAVRADRANWTIGLPGDWRILPLVLIVFVLKYAINYIDAADPALARSATFHVVSLVIGGFCSGIFAGRFCAY